MTAIILSLAAALAALALLSGAPGEWGRGAVTAYVAVASALLAGAALGPVAPAVGACGALALVIGGPWGAILAGFAAAGVAVAGWLGLGAGPHPLMAPGLALAAFAAGARGLL
jgi:hypothetical protein